MTAHLHVSQGGKMLLSPFTPTSPNPGVLSGDSTQADFYTSKPKLLTRYGSHGGLYQATADRQRDQDGESKCPIFEPPGILYKVVSGEEAIKALRTEANLYCEQLKTLQGRFVPIFRGYFEGKLVDGTEAVCMVVSSCGITGSGQLRAAKADHLVWKPIKQAWVNALIEIHKAGVQYGDDLPKMVITKDQKNPAIMRIADFKTATTGHSDCQGLGPAGPSYEAHTILGVDEDKCCPELLRFCEIIEFWAPPNIVYGNDILPVDPEFNVGKLVKHARKWLVPNEHWPEAFQCYIDYTKAWGPEKRHQELLKERAEWEKQKNALPTIGDGQVQKIEQ